MWPDNIAALTLFQFMRTQWRSDMNGPHGLDYNVLHNKMTRMGLSPEEFDQLEDDVRVMEVAALNCIHAKP